MKEMKIAVNKIEVAERQLTEAIRLFFENRDEVAIHTLVAAAHGVLRDIGKSSGIESTLIDGVPVRETKKREWISIVRRAQNFFKHADHDPDATFEFVTMQTTIYLVDAVEMLSAIAESSPIEVAVFRAWFRMKHPEFFVFDEQAKTFFSAWSRVFGSEVDNFESILSAIKDPMLPKRFPNTILERD